MHHPQHGSCSHHNHDSPHRFVGSWKSGEGRKFRPLQHQLSIHPHYPRHINAFRCTKRVRRCARPHFHSRRHANKARERVGGRDQRRRTWFGSSRPRCQGHSRSRNRVRPIPEEISGATIRVLYIIYRGSYLFTGGKFSIEYCARDSNLHLLSLRKRRFRPHLVQNHLAVDNMRKEVYSLY